MNELGSSWYAMFIDEQVNKISERIVAHDFVARTATVDLVVAIEIWHVLFRCGT